jgi:hypothetical protein
MPHVGATGIEEEGEEEEEEEEEWITKQQQWRAIHTSHTCQ